MDMPEEKIDPRVIQSEELGWKFLFNIKAFSKVHLLLMLISKNTPTFLAKNIAMNFAFFARINFFVKL